MIPCLSMRYHSVTQANLGPGWCSTSQNRQQIASTGAETADSGKATVCTTKLTFPPRQNTGTARQDGGWLDGVWKKQHGPKNVSFIVFYFWRAKVVVVVVNTDTQWINSIDFTLRSEMKGSKVKHKLKCRAVLCDLPHIVHTKGQMHQNLLVWVHVSPRQVIRNRIQYSK